MNISDLDKFKINIKLYQIVYLLIIISILFIIIFQIFNLKNIIYYEYKGKVLENSFLEIENLHEYEVVNILNSKKIYINKSLVKNDFIIEQVNNSYNLKLKLPKSYLNNEIITIKCVINEEKLYQFIFRIMKGELK